MSKFFDKEYEMNDNEVKLIGLLGISAVIGPLFPPILIFTIPLSLSFLTLRDGRGGLKSPDEMKGESTRRKTKKKETKITDFCMECGKRLKTEQEKQRGRCNSCDTEIDATAVLTYPEVG